MIRNRIGMKLGLVIASVFLVVLLVLGVTMYQMFFNFYHTEMKTEVSEMTSHFITMAETTNASSEDMMLTFADFSNVSIFYINAQGKITLHSGEHNAADRSFIYEEDIKKIFSGESISIEHQDPSGSRYVVIGQPIYEGNTISSAIYVMASTANMDKSLTAVRNLLILAGIGAFLLAIGITWIMAQLLSRPLIQMQQATKRIAIGELETRLEIESKDEFGDLAAAINNLAADLQRYRDTRQEFFANISHELRTPITYLKGYAKVVKNRIYDTEEEKDRYLDIIYQEASRIEHLVSDLFELAKMEEGKISLSMEWVDMKDIVEQAVQKIELKAKEKEIYLKIQAPDSIPLIRGDGLRMEQIVLNLVENAVRYTDKGTVKVSVSSSTNRVTLLVEDTGIGIPTDELSFIFDRFYRVEKSRSRQYGGTGLGLSIVRNLVELQGGTIKVSSSVGKGTCFKIQFPSLTIEEELR
ncbi:sensor histidine kinase [Brevibacillus daliensis]|uniref:sensor histidine kinase n=1 Tax=Brevibacillus daliensis TaxID=2892995 RepID=UPI001E57DDAA|nr:HAMP domain-containing sensor histidine kinase [Brevibacillus daliensis]